MHDLLPYAWILLAVSAAVLVAVGSNRVSERILVPAPAIFLLLAAAASDIVPELGSLSIVHDQRIVTVALVLILFDGGMHIGWSRMRTSVAAVAWLGVAGTVVTAGALALGAHYLFGLDWRTGLILGAALAPTDPAVVFSVLGRREIAGRSGTLLEGESGANDPVGIALMISLLGAGGSGWHALGSGVGHFALQLAVGTAVGLAGGWALRRVSSSLPLPDAALSAVRTLAFAPALYALATLAEGSGYLAVFLAGIAVGDQAVPFRREVESVAATLASLAEVTAFVVLGLSVDLGRIVTHDDLWIGLGVAGLLIVVVRPVLVGLVSLPIRLRANERAFVLFAGLKGAVPILLGTYVLVDGARHAQRIYDVIFVVVLVSVVLQGGLVPAVARWLKVPMGIVEPQPWTLGMRFRDEPTGLSRYVVQPGSPAEGSAVSALDVGETFWISMVSRQGRLVQLRGDTVLEAGDEVLALAEGDSPDAVFRRPVR